MRKKNTRENGGNPQITVVHTRTRGNPYEQRHFRSKHSKKGGGSSSFLHKYYSVCTHILLTLCDEVCRWSAAGRWFSPSIPVSSTNKTDLHDITKWNIVESDVKHHKPNQPTNHLNPTIIWCQFSTLHLIYEKQKFSLPYIKYNFVSLCF